MGGRRRYWRDRVGRLRLCCARLLHRGPAVGIGAPRFCSSAQSRSRLTSGRMDGKGRSLLVTEADGSADRDPANTPLPLGMQRRVRRSRHLHPARHRRDDRSRSRPGGRAVRLCGLPDRHGAVLRAAAASAAHESPLGRDPDRGPATGRGRRRRDNDRRRAARPRDHRLDRPATLRARSRNRSAPGFSLGWVS